MKRIFLAAAVLAVCSCAGNKAAKDSTPDGMVFIPAGTYMMGSEEGYSEEAPVHRVTVQAFYMDEKPVTNAQYKAFCDATGRSYPSSPRWVDLPDSFMGCPDHPVVNVSWSDAQAYAKWAGKRLPTEEEWEWAARGGIKDARYPWGNGLPNGKLLNYCDNRSEFPWQDKSQNDGFPYTSPVGSYEPNGYGLYDMAGNVCQWVEDWFFPYSDKTHDTESFKDGWGGSRVCRGGCFHSPASDVTVTRRRQILGGGANGSVGFRCVKDLEGVKHEEGAKVDYITSPAGWDEQLLKMNVTIPKGNELCVGIGAADPDMLAKLRCMGVTSVEQYVTWESCENAGEGQWDFSHWDAEVEKIRAAGLKWLPFVIAGPAYSLPDWYRASRDFEGMTCLEHNIENKIQTLWDTNFYYYIDRFLKALSDHFKDKGIFEGIMFGISGDFGEAIVPVWHGNWPQNIPGMYHSHSGYWCNDRFAKADFKDYFEKRFNGDIDALNERWGTSFHSFGAVEFPPVESDKENFRVDESTAAGTFKIGSNADRRRWIDFIDWYRESMTGYASFWMKTGRKYFPANELYLCTGGDAPAWHASEFAQQSKICAEVNGGVRITNEASVYTSNFTVTNWVASASNFYNGYFSFEPAGQVTERGVVCRVYNAAATGARSLHYYSSNILGNEERARNFADNVRFLREGGIVRKVGVLYPDTPRVLDPAKTGELNTTFALMRDYTDYTYACDLTIADGILDRLQALVITVGGWYKTATLEKIRQFAEKGGMVVGVGITELRDIDNGNDYLEILFGDGRKGHSLLIGTALSGTSESTNTSSNYRVTFGNKEQMQKEIFDPMTGFLKEGGLLINDGVLDDVFIADRGNALLIMNYSGSDVRRKVTRTDGKEVETEIPDLTIMEL